MFYFIFIYLKKYLFIYLLFIYLFILTVPGLSCGTWDHCAGIMQAL